MTHSDVLAKFFDIFWTQYHDQVQAYAPGGKYCVVIELKGGGELQFICDDHGNWRLSGKERRNVL